MDELIALFDACVLYPAPLRDFLMNLTQMNLFKARWTQAIHDEWTRNVLKDRSDLTPVQLKRTCDLMNAHVPNCLVTDYEDLIPALNLPDPDDRHVLAAAIKGEASIIVTSNLRHFPKKSLAKHSVEALHPDDFILQLMKRSPEAVLSAARQQRQSLKRPAKSVDEFLEALLRQSLPKTVAALRPFADQI